MNLNAVVWVTADCEVDMPYVELKAIGLSFVFGALFCGLVWLIVRNPWAGLFGAAVCLGRFLLDNCQLQYERKLSDVEVAMLQAEVAMLREMLRKIQAKLDRRQQRAARAKSTDPSPGEAQ